MRRTATAGNFINVCSSSRAAICKLSRCSQSLLTAVQTLTVAAQALIAALQLPLPFSTSQRHSQLLRLCQLRPSRSRQQHLAPAALALTIAVPAQVPTSATTLPRFRAFGCACCTPSCAQARLHQLTLLPCSSNLRRAAWRTAPACCATDWAPHALLTLAAPRARPQPPPSLQ